MVRRLNLSHLSQEECERILAVIQRDFELRTREKERLLKLEEELQEQALQREERQRVSDKNCALCCSAFNLLFNKRLPCAECHACVCRECCSYDSRSKVWYCRICEQQRSLRAQSCEWFYENVKMKFSQFGSTKVLLSLYGAKKDLDDLNASEQEATEIQQHIESILEGFLGEALDSACVSRMFNHLSYDQVVLDHRVPLHEAVLRFSRSLLTAMQDKPEEGDLTPTKTHVDLKQAVQSLCRDAEALPSLQDVCQMNGRRNSAYSDISGSDDCDDISFDTYEDLLVMAVINKAIEIGQRKYGLSRVAPSEKKEPERACEPDIIRTAKKDQIDVGCQSDIPFSDSGQDEEGFTTGETTESDEFFWARGLKEEAFPYIIEEKIEEEITEAYTESEDDPSRTLSDSDETTPDASVLLNLDLSQQHRVPFPEMGVDLVSPDVAFAAEEEEQEEKGGKENEGEGGGDPGILVSSVIDWEENWLFRKKQRSAALAAFRGGRYAKYFDPISMLIPNPSEDERVLLGSRDVDELSEMSEKLSVGSLELPSLSESEEEVEPTTDLQQNLEPVTAPVVLAALSSQKTLMNGTSPLLEVGTTPMAPLWTSTPRMSKTKTDSANLRPIPKPRNSTAEQTTSTPRKMSASQKEDPITAAQIVRRQLRIPKFKPLQDRRAPKDTSLRFLSQPDATTTLHRGKTAKFVCEVSSPKMLGVAWFRGSERLVRSDTSRPHRLRGKEYVLELYNVGKEDQGTYSAVAFTDKDELWCDFSLVVRETTRAPNKPEFTVAPHVTESTGNGCVRISCTVSGYPEPRVSFLHNSLPIPEEEDGYGRFAIENEGYGEWSLQVENPTAEDEGEYSAVVKNALGQKVQTVVFRLADLKVKPTSRPPAKEHHPRQPRPPLIKSRTGEDEGVLVLHSRGRENSDVPSAYDELSSFKNVDEEIEFAPSLELLNAPPKPGTIAEREHAKWLNAVPLRNNPYSAENLTRRASLGRKDSLLSNTAHDDVDGVLPISDEDQCDFSSPVLPAACLRDYYVNNPKLLAAVEAPSMLPRKLSGGRSTPTDAGGCGPEEALHSFEEQMYASPRKAFSPTFQQRQSVDSNVPTIETPPPGIVHATASMIQSNMEQGDVVRDTSRPAVEEDLCPSLPSVRELVLRFASPSAQSSLDLSSTTDSGTPSPGVEIQNIFPEKPVILEEREKNGISRESRKELLQVSEQWNMKKDDSVVQSRPQPLPRKKLIHSLTARSLSREFREHAQKNLTPRQVHRTHLAPSYSAAAPLTDTTSTLSSTTDHSSQHQPPTGDVTPGYASDESSASSAGTPARVIGAKRRQKPAASRGLLQRTSYWERRAEQGLLSDSSVTEEFPPLNGADNREM